MLKTQEKEVKIDKIILNIDGEKVSLSMEQAKKLKNILNELFGKEIVKEVVKEHHYHNDWYYQKPYYWGNSIYPKFGDIVYCNDVKASMLEDSKVHENVAQLSITV